MNFTPRHVAAITLVAVAPWIIATAINEDNVRDSSTVVTIVGQGTAPQEAQLLTMRAGVTTFATTAGQAWGKNARAMAELRSELKGQGISDVDIRSERGTRRAEGGDVASIVGNADRWARTAHRGYADVLIDHDFAARSATAQRRCRAGHENRG